MKTKTISILTAAAVSFAFAVPATALACGGEGGRTHGGFFQKADKNKDGYLTQDEVGAKHWDHIKIADVNNDNKVSQQEMQQAFAGMGPGGRFERADKNSDGYLTEDEVGAKRWERLKVADVNNDKKVSKAEIAQAFKDGKLGKRHGQKRAS
jgi:hypothetical protein